MTFPWREDYLSWGRTVVGSHLVLRPHDMDEAARAVADASLTTLPYGCGRSYGDVGLNPGGRLIDCRSLDRFLAFEAETGLLRCEAGVRLADILAVICRPESDGSGWFLPVTPGTRFVTVGGAIANDVHGKNHHEFGTFGNHVQSLELARSDGSRIICSPSDHPELFAATLGGLGLTGLILNATLKLRRVQGFAVEAEDIRFDTLANFFELADESDQQWEYTAAWVDCLASGKRVGRGIYSRARHCVSRSIALPSRKPKVSVPFTPPFSLVNNLSLRTFNALYWRRLGRTGRVRRVCGYEPVLYPLDAVCSWNRLYGPKGFHQFQCVIPSDDAHDIISDMLRLIAKSGQGSMLVVLKKFGDLPSAGLLSFPKPGVTLALDFPEKGAKTRDLLAKLEAIVGAADGRLYPAKDSTMTSETFRRGHPNYELFKTMIDPNFSSAFSRRVGLTPGTRQL